MITAHLFVLKKKWEITKKWIIRLSDLSIFICKYNNTAWLLGYVKKLWEHVFLKAWSNTSVFKSKKNLSIKKSELYWINCFWVINELDYAVALKALNIANIKAKVFHNPWNVLEFLKKYSSLWEEVLMRHCTVHDRRKS